PAVATCSSSPACGWAPALATRTSTARPTAAPTPAAVLTIPEATPCSRAVTPVEAAVNMVVDTSPSPAPTATRPGTHHPHLPAGGGGGGGWGPAGGGRRGRRGGRAPPAGPAAGRPGSLACPPAVTR